MLDPKDGGYSSRKLWFAIGAGLVMVGCWMLTGKWPALSPTYDVLVGGLLTLTGLFTTGNVASKWVIAKSAGTSFQGELPGAPPAPAAPQKDTKPAAPPVEEEGS